MVTVYPRLSDAELEALPSRTEASIYRNAYEIACWLKERHDAVVEPGEHLPSSQKAVAVYTWKSPKINGRSYKKPFPSWSKTASNRKISCYFPPSR